MLIGVIALGINFTEVKAETTTVDVTTAHQEAITTPETKAQIFVVEKAKPDVVLVHGDTTTSTAAALAAFYQQIPVGHVEAGLRTHNIYSPWPEEMNRQITGRIATYHFSPTALSKKNLLTEGVQEDKITVTGNTVIDALKKTVKDVFDFHNPKLEAAIRSNHKLILMTTHRRENLGAPMRHVYQALKEVLRDYPEAEAIFLQLLHRSLQVGGAHCDVAVLAQKGALHALEIVTGKLGLLSVAGL